MSCKDNERNFKLRLEFHHSGGDYVFGAPSPESGMIDYFKERTQLLGLPPPTRVRPRLYIKIP